MVYIVKVAMNNYYEGVIILDYTTYTCQILLHAIGHKITVLRTANGLTQKQLAYRAGISASYLGKLENGRHIEGVSLEILYQIAYALGVETYQLLRVEASDLRRYQRLTSYDTSHIPLVGKQQKSPTLQMYL